MQPAEEVRILSRNCPLLPQPQEPWIHALIVQVLPITPGRIHGTGKDRESPKQDRAK